MSQVRVEYQVAGSLIREGAGVKLHRYVGAERDNALEPILLLDYFDSTDILDYMAGFPSHPHRGFETITYLLHGSITHEDNKGHKGVIGAGDVQWMTAGRGIVHSEMPSTQHERLQGLQLWLNLPAAEKMRPARYQEMLNDELPRETLASGAVVKVIAGATDKGTTSPIKDIATKPLFFDISLPKEAVFSQQMPEDYQAILLVVSGQIKIAGETVEAKHLAVLSPGTLLTLHADLTSQCLLIAARKLREPIVRHGPFVMNTPEEIMQALSDSCYARSILSCHIFKLLPSNLVRSKNQFVLNSKVI
ncbi:pirin family protein [Legionella sp. km772]|uniref:pirin family protein n=1 Tax=Legionella sp. km772 TaxID=2498111 RepID=UPI000F8E6F46|nr:pirin family protein [Legionella sp. km772]RUR05378.1 pirin family protein [Legionella sp. km772]